MIISADIHIKRYSSYSTIDSNGYNSRLMDGVRVLGRLCDMSHGDDNRLVIAGDMFDERDFIATDAYVLVYDVLKRAKNSGVEVVLVTGNHETFDKTGNSCALHPLESVARVISDPTVIHFDGSPVSVACLPWLNDWSTLPEVMKRLVEHTSSAKNRILIGHAPLAGAALGASNYKLREGGATPNDLSHTSFQCVVLGHYHLPQTLEGNVHYVGSPLQLNFGECNDAKRVFKFDLQTGVLTSIPMTGSPKFYEGGYEDGQVHIMSTTGEDPIDGFLKVYCQSSDDLHAVQKAIDKVKAQYHLRSVQLERVRPDVKQEVRLAVNVATQDHDVIVSYVDYVTTTLDKDLLKSLGGSLLHGKDAKEICAQICEV